MIYGKPFDRGTQVDRILRRGIPGVTPGRSEATAPITSRRRRGTVTETGGGATGPGGAPGLPLTDGFKAGGSRGVLASFSAGSDFLGMASASGMGTKTSSSTPNTFVGVDSSGPNVVQVGLGNGRGGYLSVTQFRFLTIPATRTWFAGSSQLSPVNTGPLVRSFVGVGQDAGETSPRFVHAATAAFPPITRISTGLADVSVGPCYEVRVFADPFGTTFQISLEVFNAAGVSTAYVTYNATTNIPSITMMPCAAWIGNGAGGGVASIRCAHMYVNIQPRSMTINGE